MGYHSRCAPRLTIALPLCFSAHQARMELRRRGHVRVSRRGEDPEKDLREKGLQKLATRCARTGLGWGGGGGWGGQLNWQAFRKGIWNRRPTACDL